MSAKEERLEEHKPDILETQLGPADAGLPEIPEPSEYDSSYGIDEAVAIPVTPHRALIFWELAGLISTGEHQGKEFRLIRLRLEGEKPLREAHYGIEAIGRFQDSGVKPGKEYLYVIARVDGGEETPLMVTNPIRMPLDYIPGRIPGEFPSSIDLTVPAIKRALREEG